MNTVLSGTITDMISYVNVPAVNQAFSFTNSSTPTIPSWSTYCGPMTYSLTPTSGFLSISGTTISLATTNVADVGPHSMVLTVAMANYPAMTLTKSFTVTITCVVQILTFTTVPSASNTLKYSNLALDLPFVTNQTPACGKTVSFAIIPAKPFLGLPSPTVSGGSVRISGATYVDIGNYAETLTATVDGQTTSANFSVIIVDPCETAVF